jgi:hypothetical protein
MLELVSSGQDVESDIQHVIRLMVRQVTLEEMQTGVYVAYQAALASHQKHGAGGNYVITYIPGVLTVTPIGQNTTLMPNILTTLDQANNFINPSLILDRTMDSMNLTYLGVGQFNPRSALPSASGDAGDLRRAYITSVSVIECDDPTQTNVICKLDTELHEISYNFMTRYVFSFIISIDHAKYPYQAVSKGHCPLSPGAISLTGIVQPLSPIASGCDSRAYSPKPQERPSRLKGGLWSRGIGQMLTTRLTKMAQIRRHAYV